MSITEKDFSQIVFYVGKNSVKHFTYVALFDFHNKPIVIINIYWVLTMSQALFLVPNLYYLI